MQASGLQCLKAPDCAFFSRSANPRIFRYGAFPENPITQDIASSIGRRACDSPAACVAVATHQGPSKSTAPWSLPRHTQADPGALKRSSIKDQAVHDRTRRAPAVPRPRDEGPPYTRECRPGTSRWLSPWIIVITRDFFRPWRWSLHRCACRLT